MTNKKQCIFKRLSRVTEFVEDEIIYSNIGNLVLLGVVFDAVEKAFKEFTGDQQDTLIMRIYDNLERGQLNSSLNF